MRALTLASVRAHLPRLIASTLAIVIAVGFVVATLVLNQTVKATVQSWMTGARPNHEARRRATPRQPATASPTDSRSPTTIRPSQCRTSVRA